MFEEVASSTAIVIVFDVVVVLIPSPSAIVNVSPNAILSDVEPSEKLKNAFVIAEFGMFVIVEFEPLMFATNSAELQL